MYEGGWIDGTIYIVYCKLVVLSRVIPYLQSNATRDDHTLLLLADDMLQLPLLREPRLEA
jgi:hypothetical protein